MQISEKMLEDLLESMSETGEILALCPKCRIPLDKKERMECCCTQCGSIDNSSILFKINNAEKC